MASPLAAGLAFAQSPWATAPAAPTAWYDPSSWGGALSNIDNGLGQHYGALLGLGGALLSGNLGNIGPALTAGVQEDRQRNLQNYQLGLQAQQRNATAQWARDNGYGEYADAIEAGAISGSDIFNLINKQTVVPNGSSVINGKGDLVSSPGAGFAGNDLKSQAWNTILRGQGDPQARSTPQYAAAWSIVTEPTMTPQGMMQPNIPQAWAPITADTPATGTPQVTAPNSTATWDSRALQGGQPLGSDVAPIGSMAGTPQTGFQSVSGPAPAVRGPGIIPGTQPFNESQARTTMLTQSAIPDLKRVIDGFPSMLNLKDQMLQKVPGNLGRILQDPEYKQAQDAMTSAIGNVLYVASGANLNAGELQRKVDAYTPAVGDDPKTAANKLDRFANDIIVLANQTKDPATIQWAQQAADGLTKTRDQLLSGNGPSAPNAKPAPKPGTIEDGYMFKGGDPSDQRNWAPAT